MAATCEVKRIVHKRLPTAIRGPRQVKVGFPAGESAAGAIQKAVWNEFGTRGGASGGGWGGPILERPFMRNAIRNNEGKYKAALRTSAEKILLGTTSLSIVMHKLGNLAQDDIIAEIDSGVPPKNADATVALKGSSHTLIDTGNMKQSVRYKVVE